MAQDHHAATATPQPPDGGTHTGPTTHELPGPAAPVGPDGGRQTRQRQQAGAGPAAPVTPRSLVDRRAEPRTRARCAQ